MINIAILASGNGTNAENIARLFAQGNKARVVLVLCNNRNAGVYARMAPLGVETLYVPNSQWNTDPESVIGLLRRHDVDLVVLAGFMHLLPKEIVEAFPRKILNIHPSLLPKYGGKGMYGHHVHEAVVAAGEQESGVTVHYVDEHFDTGEIVMQERIHLSPGETAESLEAKIHPVEYALYPRAIEYVIDNQDPRQSEMAEQDENPKQCAASAGDVDAQWAKALRINYDPKQAEASRRAQAEVSQSSSSHPQSTQAQTPSERAAAFWNDPNRPPMPASYMVFSVLALIFCCLIPGIIAIVYSAKVSGKYYAGDIQGAEKCSRLAQIWIIVSFCLGVLWSTLSIPLMLASGSMGV